MKLSQVREQRQGFHLGLDSRSYKELLMIMSEDIRGRELCIRPNLNMNCLLPRRVALLPTENFREYDENSPSIGHRQRACYF